MSEARLNNARNNPLDYPWFPFAFAIGFPLTVYSHNQAAFAGADVVRPVLFFLLIALLLIVIVRQVVSNRPLASALAAIPLTCIWMLGLGWPTYLAILLWSCAVFLLRNRSLPGSMTPVLNALAVGVLCLPVFAIIQVEIVTRDNALQNIPYSPFATLDETVITTDKPDIYHIVLDAYTGTDALAAELGFDNSAVFDQLRDMNFVVNESIVAPYNETVHVMSAIFLGEYLREGAFPIDSASSTELRSTLGALIPNGPVHQILRENGYSTLYTDSGHTFLRFPKDATVLRPRYSSPLNMFELHLGTTARLDDLLPELYEVTQEDPLILAVKNAFENDYSEFESPKFVYQHVLAPHTPFTVDRYGAKTDEFWRFTTTKEGDSVVLDNPALRRKYVRGYLEKLRYVNDELLGQIRKLRQLPGNKVIIVHGDHGSGSKYFLEDPNKTCLRERFSTFVAVYADDPLIQNEFRWITAAEASTVNIYRSLINGLLGQNLELLPGHSSFVRYSAPHELLPLDRERILQACD